MGTNATPPGRRIPRFRAGSIESLRCRVRETDTHGRRVDVDPFGEARTRNPYDGQETRVHARGNSGGREVAAETARFARTNALPTKKKLYSTSRSWTEICIREQ